MTNIVKQNEVKDLTEFQITEEDTLAIEKFFSEVPAVVVQLDAIYNKIIALSSKDITEDLSEQAKELSAKYAKVRTKFIDAGHKEAKNYSLQYGRYCDHMKKEYYKLVKPKEEELDKIANHFKELERIAKAELKAERLSIINKIDPDGNYEYTGLEDMLPDVFDHFIAGVEIKVAKAKEDAKLLEEARLAKEQVDKIARERAEEEARVLREENARLAEAIKTKIDNTIPTAQDDLSDYEYLDWMFGLYRELRSKLDAKNIQSEEARKIFNNVMLAHDKIINYLNISLEKMEK